MKSQWIVLVSLIALIGLSVLGLRSCQRAGWERSLWGPYSGLQFTGEITNTPVSALLIPLHGRLEVYELASQTGPVLVLRSKTGAVQWSRLLVPERRLDDGQLQQAWVRELRLEQLKQGDNGHQVLITCDWEWGGREGGLIDLDSNYGFKGFRLSW
jgi:hypothetical protein